MTQLNHKAKRKEMKRQDSLRILANQTMLAMSPKELQELAEDQLITVYEDEREGYLEHDLKKLDFHLDEYGMLIDQDGECINSKTIIRNHQKELKRKVNR